MLLCFWWVSPRVTRRGSGFGAYSAAVDSGRQDSRVLRLQQDRPGSLVSAVAAQQSVNRGGGDKPPSADFHSREFAGGDKSVDRRA
jgi:hypothetical protein